MRAALMICISALVQAALSPAMAAPITFNTALPVARGEFVFRQQFVLDRATGDRTAANRKRTSAQSISVLVYGVSPELTLFAAAPVVYNRLRVTAGGARRTRKAHGLGDIRLFGRYTVYARNWTGATFRVAPFFGLELPTGEATKTDGLGRLPPGLQTGSGSLDPFGGIVASFQSIDWGADAQVSFKANTEAKGVNIGDVARFDASVQYRLWPRELTAATPGFLFGLLEVNVVHQGKTRIAGVTNPNSGGLSVFLAPGLQYATRRWILETAVQFPIIQDLNGTALKRDFTVRAGFRVNF